jgi:hypothetical protein
VPLLSSADGSRSSGSSRSAMGNGCAGTDSGRELGGLSASPADADAACSWGCGLAATCSADLPPNSRKAATPATARLNTEPHARINPGFAFFFFRPGAPRTEREAFGLPSVTWIFGGMFTGGDSTGFSGALCCRCGRLLDRRSRCAGLFFGRRALQVRNPIHGATMRTLHLFAAHGRFHTDNLRAGLASHLEHGFALPMLPICTAQGPETANKRLIGGSHLRNGNDSFRILKISA